jgi:hypothetical protein
MWYRPQRSSDVLGGALVAHDFAPDRTCSVLAIDERTGVVLQSTPEFLYWWWVRDGKLILTHDRNLGLVDRVRGCCRPVFAGRPLTAPDPPRPARRRYK